MPELPEVETTKRGIAPFLLHQTIGRIIVRQPRLRYPITGNIQRCQNQTLLSVSRRAKYLILELSRGALLIHLGMSGHLRLFTSEIKAGKHDHVDLVLHNGHTLRYCDPRRFGFWLYIPGDPFEHPLLRHLGPEPLSAGFNGDYLHEQSRSKNASIKSLLMRNEIVVGLGNIYATESLYLAGLHPQKPAGSLSLEESHLLAGHIKNILEQAINAGGTTLKDFHSMDGKPGYFAQSLQIYGRKNLPCFKCGSFIQTLKINGRHSAYCPSCQML